MISPLDHTTHFPITYDLTDQEKEDLLANCKYWYSVLTEAVFAEDYNQCEVYKNDLNSFIAAMEKKGYYIRYDWVGHRGEFFLATKSDYMLQQEYEDGIF